LARHLGISSETIPRFDKNLQIRENDLFPLHRRQNSDYFIPELRLDLFIVQHAPIEGPAWEHSLLISVDMKLRPTASRSLQRQLQNPSRLGSLRPGLCLQCRQQLRRRQGDLRSSPMDVRSIVTSASPCSRERQQRLVFPAPVITGQRRTLATVQNGISLSLIAHE
jgi:hypothetical protein